MAVELGGDVELLKSEIKKTYAAVSREPDTDFIFPTGRADESFDVVVSNGVIDLIPDKDAVFAELYRVLRLADFPGRARGSNPG